MTTSDHGTLRDELKQNRPFRSVGQEAVLGLMRTTDQVRRILARPLGPKGLTLAQYNVLRILRGAGEEGLATLSIADRLVEHAPGVTRLLDRLERKGLVARRRDAEDRRRVVCTITGAGRALLAELDPAVDALDDEVLGTLDEEEKRTLITLLDRIRAAHGGG